MKRVVRVKLLPDTAQAVLLSRTLATINTAACEVSAVARQRRIYHEYDLRKVTYSEIREHHNLGSQIAQNVIRKVADSYKTHRKNLTNGNYGKVGTPRRAAAAVKVLEFRPDAAQAFDARTLSWKMDTKTVSIWTLEGRNIIRFAGRESDLELLAQHPIGETDLVRRDGSWYLMATVDLPDVDVKDPKGFVGVDLGVALIAATEHVGKTGRRISNSGTDWSGGAVTKRRNQNRRLRKRLQSRDTKSSKRLLKKRTKKEARFVTDVNHQISKRIVTEAKRTGRGIAAEDLSGIRERVRLRKPQRVMLHSWAFAQLGGFLVYKAEAAGVAFTQVNPAYTSQTCSKCGNVDKKARLNQGTYKCTNKKCRISLNADHNAAVNIARRGIDCWGARQSSLDAVAASQPVR